MNEEEGEGKKVESKNEDVKDDEERKEGPENRDEHWD